MVVDLVDLLGVFVSHKGPHRCPRISCENDPVLTDNSDSGGPFQDLQLVSSLYLQLLAVSWLSYFKDAFRENGKIGQSEPLSLKKRL